MNGVCNYALIGVAMRVTRTVLRFHPRTQSHIFISVSEALRCTVPADLSHNVHTKFLVDVNICVNRNRNCPYPSTLLFSANYDFKFRILLCVTSCSLTGGNQKTSSGDGEGRDSSFYDTLVTI